MPLILKLLTLLLGEGFGSATDVVFLSVCWQEMKRLKQQPRTRNAHPYTVKENNDHINVVSIALTASDRAMTSRVNADVTNIPDVKYAS